MRCHPCDAKMEIDDLWDNDMNHVNCEMYWAQAKEWKSQVQEGTVLGRKGPNLLHYLWDIGEKVESLQLEREQEELDRHKHVADEVKNMKVMAAIQEQEDEADCGGGVEEFDKDAAMMYGDGEESFDNAFMLGNPKISMK